MKRFREYLGFIFSNFRFLLFGLIMTCLSGFGQTFFIGMFNADIRAVFDLGHKDFGLIYSLATLASSFSIPWFGKKIDDVPLMGYTLAILFTLGLACFGLAFANSLVLLFLSFYLLRLAGQGLSGHTAITAMSRYFKETRGKAIGFASLGYPVSEALFPLGSAALIAIGCNWQQLWYGSGISLWLIFIPIISLLLLGYREKYSSLKDTLADKSKEEAKEIEDHQERHHYTRKEVSRDWYFYLILPIVVSPAFMNTMVFFHQNHLVDIRGWTQGIFAQAFVVYATTTVIASLLGGMIVDRLSAKKLLSIFTIPLGLGLIILGSFDHISSLYLFMALSGLSSGVAVIMSGALWAELYGTLHLGSIRSFVMFFIIFASAVSPFLSGVLLDLNISYSSILWTFGIGVLAANALSIFGKQPSQ